MTRTVDLQRETAFAGTGVVTIGATNSGKIPTRGHFHWALTTVSTGTATVLLKGTNNPDPASTTGETLITNTHGAANQQDGSTSAAKGYKYVFIHVTANAADVSKFFLLGTGFAGTH